MGRVISEILGYCALVEYDDGGLAAVSLGTETAVILLIDPETHGVHSMHAGLRLADLSTVGMPGFRTALLAALTEMIAPVQSAIDIPMFGMLTPDGTPGAWAEIVSRIASRMATYEPIRVERIDPTKPPPVMPSWRPSQEPTLEELSRAAMTQSKPIRHHGNAMRGRSGRPRSRVGVGWWFAIFSALGLVALYLVLEDCGVFGGQEGMSNWGDTAYDIGRVVGFAIIPFIFGIVVSMISVALGWRSKGGRRTIFILGVCAVLGIMAIGHWRMMQSYLSQRDTFTNGGAHRDIFDEIADQQLQERRQRDSDPERWWMNWENANPSIPGRRLWLESLQEMQLKGYTGDELDQAAEATWSVKIEEYKTQHFR